MQLKRVDPNAVIYHYFERSPSEFVLYDDEMDMPVAYGSRNLVDAKVRSLSPRISIAYYKRDVDKTSFKKKFFFRGKIKETPKNIAKPANPT